MTTNRYRTKPVTVHAVALVAPATIGGVDGVAGDYLVTYPTGVLELVKAADFKGRFRGPFQTGGRKPKAEATDVDVDEDAELA
jgi:hypothetical protein